MSFLSIRGLIIKSVPYKESDRIIRILTMDKGIVQARVPGAGKSTSRYSYSTVPLMLCDFVLAKTHDYYYLRESEIIEAFQPVQTDIEKLTAAAHLLEITSDVCVDHETCRMVYPLLAYTLHALSSPDRSVQMIVSVFEWKILGLLGYTADLGLCVCKEADPNQYGAFSFTQCRLFCKKASCLEKAGNYQFLSPGCVEALKYSTSAPVDKIFSFTISPKIQNEMSGISRKYLCERLEKNYTRMDLLQNMPEWPMEKSDS
jgi:DNA repair protein RecO (recombination protein O)